MIVATLPGRLLERLRHPRTTVRWRLTVLYGLLFLVCGAGLLAITYGLVQHASAIVSPDRLVELPYRRSAPAGASRPGFEASKKSNSALPPAIRRLIRSRAGRTVAQIAGSQQRKVDLHQLEIESFIALALMALLSGLFGWVLAGRVLAPLRTMASRTREISEENLHERLALAGPPDELHQLADTIDALLARLQGAFDAQRRFVANASHELRTPLTAVRALLEMALSDPDADLESFRSVCVEALEETATQQQLIDALLTLARGQRGLDRHERLDLAAITADVLAPRGLEAGAQGLQVECSLSEAPLEGDRWLVTRLVANLVDNAVRHNVAGGQVVVSVTTVAGRAAVMVRNTGPVVPAPELRRLLAPFQRLVAERVGDDASSGLGLGLSIVEAIVHAHDAELDLGSQPAGGLAVTVRFPAPAEPAEPAAQAAEVPDGGASVAVRSGTGA
ncbi:MAG TPA: ATP-binding protein [Solirubrobacteraceae bacterium]